MESFGPSVAAGGLAGSKVNALRGSSSYFASKASTFPCVPGSSTLSITTASLGWVTEKYGSAVTMSAKA